MTQILPDPLTLFLLNTFLLMFNYSCLHLLHSPTPPQTNPPPSPASTLPLGFAHVSFMVDLLTFI